MDMLNLTDEQLQRLKMRDFADLNQVFLNSFVSLTRAVVHFLYLYGEDEEDDFVMAVDLASDFITSAFNSILEVFKSVGK